MIYNKQNKQESITYIHVYVYFLDIFCNIFSVYVNIHIYIYTHTSKDVANNLQKLIYIIAMGSSHCKVEMVFHMTNLLHAGEKIFAGH